MSRTTRRAGGPSQAPMRPPEPPPGGWTLMEAAEALCPREAGLYKQGGPALDAAMGVDKNGKRDPGASPDVWLSKPVVAVVAKRPELAITGRDVTRHIRDGRFRLARDVLQAASRDRPSTIGPHETSQYEVRVRLGFHAGTAHIESSLIKEYWTETSSTTLIEVRIEASVVADAEAVPQGSRELRDAGIGAPIKPEFSEALLRAWFRMRVHGWPKDKPPPSGKECLAAAREYFSGNFTRALFRDIRPVSVPGSWQRRGRRRPPN